MGDCWRTSLLCPAADTYRRQEPSSLAVACYVRYLFAVSTDVAQLTVRTGSTCVQDAYQSPSVALGHSRCLRVVSGDHQRILTAQDEGRGQLPARKVVDRHEAQEAPLTLASWLRYCIKERVAGILHLDRSRSELADS
jgi:hypothetical protein